MTTRKMLVLVVVMGFLAAPAYGMDAAIFSVPGQNLTDFQKHYDGTKGIVAWNKFHEYQALKNAPQPTLGISRMRITPSEMNTLADYEEYYSGTKSIVAFNKFALGEKPLVSSETQTAPRKAGLQYRESKLAF